MVLNCWIAFFFLCMCARAFQLTLYPLSTRPCSFPPLSFLPPCLTLLYHIYVESHCSQLVWLAIMTLRSVHVVLCIISPSSFWRLTNIPMCVLSHCGPPCIHCSPRVASIFWVLWAALLWAWLFGTLNVASGSFWRMIKPEVETLYLSAVLFLNLWEPILVFSAAAAVSQPRQHKAPNFSVSSLVFLFPVFSTVATLMVMLYCLFSLKYPLFWGLKR